ncbi:uncharacterized protein ACIB01_008795 isoform 2-T2 [Guaruba guarouba]
MLRAAAAAGGSGEPLRSARGASPAGLRSRRRSAGHLFPRPPCPCVCPRSSKVRPRRRGQRRRGSSEGRGQGACHSPCSG